VLYNVDFASNHFFVCFIFCILTIAYSSYIQKLEKLRFLNCGNNNLTQLVLMEKVEGHEMPLLPVIEQLYCYNNELSTLSIHKCVNLKILNCANNPLTYLNCGHNSLESLDISNNTLLKKLVCCCNQQLTNLDIRACINLTFIQAHNDKIASLDTT